MSPAKKSASKPLLPVVDETVRDCVAEEFRSDPSLYQSTMERMLVEQPVLMAYMGVKIEQMGHSQAQKSKRVQILIETYHLLETQAQLDK